MAKKALLLILDSVGCGGATDAHSYGDAGANTLGHLFEESGVPRLPNLISMGLGEVLGLEPDPTLPRLANTSGCRLREVSAGKDTTTGHWELAGCPTLEPFFTCLRFEDGFVAELSRRGGVGFLGNRVASGTEILEDLGEEHCLSGKPIIYTSADSVLQIAAHEEIFGEERLQELCRTARALLDEREMRVGRVISRPFVGSREIGFQRTSNRHDYSLVPGETILDRLGEKGVRVIGVGKIADIFAGRGIDESFPTKSNRDGMAEIGRLWGMDTAEDQFIFANLVDFDSLFGHRRDPAGYAGCLEEFDGWLGDFLKMRKKGELMVITADHGNDPYHRGTDHTREEVPCLIAGDDGMGTEGMSEFQDVGRRIESYFSENRILPI